MTTPALTTPRLALLRTRAGLSQRRLADHAGVSYQTIRRLEAGTDAGTLPLVVIHRIATRLGTSIDTLLSTQPTAGPAPSATSTPLDITQARLLRRIHRGEDIRRNLSRTDRGLTLPALINAGHVTLTPSGRPQLSERARVSLNP